MHHKIYTRLLWRTGSMPSLMAARAFLAAVEHKARPPRIAQHTLSDASGIDPPTSNQWIICDIMSREWTTSPKFPLKSPGLLFLCTGGWRDCLKSAEASCRPSLKNTERRWFSARKHHDWLCHLPRKTSVSAATLRFLKPPQIEGKEAQHGLCKSGIAATIVQQVSRFSSIHSTSWGRGCGPLVCSGETREELLEITSRGCGKITSIPSEWRQMKQTSEEKLNKYWR